jgi:bifunctional aromatase (cyclase/dehydratase)
VPLPTDDIVQIQQLAARYNHAVDSGDGDAFAQTFVPDGRLVAGNPIAGRDALAAFAAEVPRQQPGIRHWVGNVFVDGEGDRATMKAYIRVTANIGAGDSRAELMTGRYEDTLVKDGDRWYFAERVCTPD